MPITDGMIARVLPAAGDTAIKDAVSNANFSGTGSPTLVDEDTEKAWSITTGTLLDLPVPTKTINASAIGTGATVALRFKQTNNGSGADFLRLVGIRDSSQTIEYSMWIGRNGNSRFRGRIRGSSGDASPANLDSTLPNGTVHTLVFRVSVPVSGTVPALWRNRTGRVGTSADVTGATTSTGATSFNSVFINCQSGVAFTLLDFIYWDRELTDAECTAVADDIRGALTVTPIPVTFNGTVNNQSATVGASFNLGLSSFFTGNQPPFTYSLIAGDLTGTGLSLNASTGVISGTPSATGAISGLQVRATDTVSNTAQTNAFSITVAAAPQVPQGSFNVGSIAVTSSTASVPYTYSSSDQTSIQYTLNGGTTTFTATASPQNLTGLSASTTYTIQFRAVNATGNGSWSTGVPFTTSAVSTASFNLVGLVNNVGVAWISTSITVDVYNPTTGVLVVRKTGLTTDSNGNVTVTDAAMTATTNYTAVITIGSARGVVSVTAS